MVKFECEYPCGTKIKVSQPLLLVTLFGIIKPSEKSMWDCPLHGKDCQKRTIK